MTVCRSPADAPLRVAYQWYVSRYQPGAHPTHPDSMFGFVRIDTGTASMFEQAAIEDLRASRNASTVDDANITAALAAVATHGLGDSLRSAVATTQQWLQSAWSEASVKVICMQDEIDDGKEDARQVLGSFIREFLALRYPTPSQYELPDGRSNGCRWVGNILEQHALC